MSGARRVAEVGESGLLARIAERLASHTAGLPVGIGDDAAVVNVSAGQQVLTCDAMVDGVHFRRDWSSMSDVGWKALASNVSDIVAMGGRPCHALVTLGLAPDLSLADFDAFFDGLLACAERFATRIVGGDLVRSESFFVSIALTGAIDDGAPFRNNGARPGDAIWVSGLPGQAELGLRLVKAGISDWPALIACHRRPVPRPDLVEPLRALLPSAVTDTSDGLARDLRKIASASGVGAFVDLAALPYDETMRLAAARLGLELPRVQASGGDDYALLFTLPEGVAGPDGCTRIGMMTDERNVRFTGPGQWETLADDGYDHFAPTDAT